MELGIADAQRLAVAGQSGGEFATYSLTTQTDRFEAAIVINGPASNFTSYGTFSGQSRYWDESHGVSDSPANLRDRWQQIFRWLETYLRQE